MRIFAAIALSILTSGPAQAATVPSPESVLGFAPGTDRRLADWTQIVDYFQKLDAASDRVQVQDVGKTTEGRPFLVAVITSAANMERLEEIRAGQVRLADPRGLAPAEVERLIGRGKVVVAVHHGIHSDEVAATQTAMETAYALATDDSPETKQILDRVVVVMIPSHNPDGTQKVTEWYRSTVGTAWEGADPPFLYHHFTGHDNNRDWYMFTQRESRLTVEHVYEKWRPQVVHDIHEMGARSARLFVPPYVDPWEPNVDHALISAVSDLGSFAAARVIEAGRKGVVLHAIYDAWTPARAFPHTHGGVRILSESAQAKMATPLEVRFEDLTSGIGYDPKQRSWNFPAPWPGGTWRLHDIMEDQKAVTRAILEHAATHREHWLRLSHGVNRRSSERTSPYAFVVPSGQDDPLAVAKLVEVLRLGLVEVDRARGSFTAAGRSYSAGSYVVRMAQPYGAFAKMLLERQHYPDLRPFPGGPIQRPYDVTAHTLPLLLGVDVATVTEAFAADLDPVSAVSVTPGTVSGRGSWLALGHTTADLVGLGRLLRAGVRVQWATAEFAAGGRRYPAGTLLVPQSARARVETLARELGIDAQAVATAPAGLALRAPRVGVYQSWVPSMDEGWTRFVFEHHVGVEYETLHDRDIRRGSLRARFDAIVIPDQPPAAILNGHASGSLPEELTGGLGTEGVRALREFAEAGGTLVAFNQATGFAIKELALPVKDVLPTPRSRRESEPPDFYCPGAILAGATEPHLLAHGLPARTPLWFEHSPAFDVEKGATVIRYPAGNPLLSGWLLGDQKLQGKSALVEVPLGQGRVVLFGFRPQYRAQSWQTYIPLLNALYTSAATAPARAARRADR